MHKEAKKHSDSLLKMKTNRGWWQSSSESTAENKCKTGRGRYFIRVRVKFN